jgi:SnoaL-like protein
VKRWPALLLAALALSACGTEKAVDKESPAREPSAAGVIRAWADALRGGDVERAARFFALPSVVSNGTPPITLRSRAAVRLFNDSLPCGAVLERTYREGRYTAAVFRLTERPGPGRCGTGTGARARTAFVVRDGKISQWRRLPEPEAPPAPVV